MTLDQIAGTYIAMDDDVFGEKIILFEDGTAQEINGGNSYNMTFYKVKSKLNFDTGYTAHIDCQGTEFCFSTGKEVDNPDFTNDDDGYDDTTGEAIPQYITETVTHSYQKN
jgi:hypothetical protein